MADTTTTGDVIHGDVMPGGRRTSRRTRNAVLTVHIVAAVGALGADLVLLTLGVAGLVSDDPALIRAAYLAMDLLAGAVVLPLAFAALASGVILGLITHWGLIRHYWVLVKLMLTIGLSTAAVFVLRPALDRAAARALDAPLSALADGIGPAGAAAVTAPTTAMVVLLTATVLAVAKPWGTTRRGHRTPLT